MRMTAQLGELRAFKLVGRGSMVTVIQLVVQGVEQNLDEGMRVLAFEVVLASLPASIIRYIRASLREIEEVVRWSSEVLLPMSIVAHAPVMNL